MSPKVVSKTGEVFPIVGMGASAGGLEAFEAFFSHMPDACNMAFVLIQHLDPTHKSIMASLLERHTAMKVTEISDGTKVEVNHIYLNPPDKYVEIINGTLTLTDRPESYGSALPIDHFFRSLSEDQRNRAICIIFSGTGTDGTLGLRCIKAEGGLAFVQDEKEAKYDGMPRSAIDTGLADFVLPVAKIPAELTKYVEHPYMSEATSSEDQFKQNASKIFTLIRSRTGHDFSNYKVNTIRRRIGRRMAVHHLDHIRDYLKYLKQNESEIDILFKEFLITVTNFFRDPEVFELLEEKYIPEILKERPSHAPVRVWVPGCATGEEAYSIAIILLEVMRKMGKHFNVQVFATDIDPDAIEYARAGIYPVSIEADISPEQLKRYFSKEENRYRVRKQVRELVVFASQNLLTDPPFSRLDLVSCRNLLIYLDGNIQKKVIPLFHYTLYSDAILLLGPSESIGEFADLFSVLNSKWKLFKRKGALPRKVEPYSLMPHFSGGSEQIEEPPKRPFSTIDFRHLTEKLILDSYTPPSVLVDEKYNILYFHGDTRKYLSPPKGEPTFNILKMAHKNISGKLTTALHQALKNRKEVAHEVSLPHNDKLISFDLIVRPFMEPTSNEMLVMVIFEDKILKEKVKDKRVKGEADDKDQCIVGLEQELQSTKEYLQSTIEELETSNEELKSTNEELQSTNEELQSTNEELETSKEELQSTNEELSTVNSELRSKVDELSRSNDDLNNLLASTQIGTIFLDRQLKIKRFTPAMKQIFNLIETDIDRPIRDITSTIDCDHLDTYAGAVLHTLHMKELNLNTREGAHYCMRIMPYRTVDNVIDGVVITFFNITETRKIELELRNALDYSRSIVDTVREPLLVLDHNLNVLSASRSFYEKFKMDRKETEGKRIYDLGKGQWDIPELRELLEQIIPANSSFDDYKMFFSFPDMKNQMVLLNARRIDKVGDQPHNILLSMELVAGK